MEYNFKEFIKNIQITFDDTTDCYYVIYDDLTGTNCELIEDFMWRLDVTSWSESERLDWDRMILYYMAGLKPTRSKNARLKLDKELFTTLGLDYERALAMDNVENLLNQIKEANPYTVEDLFTFNIIYKRFKNVYRR